MSSPITPRPESLDHVDALKVFLARLLPGLVTQLEEDKVSAPGFPRCKFSWEETCDEIDAGKLEAPLWRRIEVAQTEMYNLAAEFDIEVHQYGSLCNCEMALGAKGDTPADQRCAFEEQLPIPLHLPPEVRVEIPVAIILRGPQALPDTGADSVAGETWRWLAPTPLFDGETDLQRRTVVIMYESVVGGWGADFKPAAGKGLGSVGSGAVGSHLLESAWSRGQMEAEINKRLALAGWTVGGAS